MTDAAPLKRGPLTVAIMLATVMQVLDTTIANVALPSMQGSLGAAQDSITWVLTSYIVASAIMTPMTGWLTDRIGLKPLFLISIVGFTVASMLCGTAGSLTEMVIWRLAQGIFGAALAPLSQTVLLNINPSERHGQAMAMWGAGVMVGPVIGPTLGGWLTETLNWRWVFYINVPVGIIAFLGILAWLPSVPKRQRGFDFIGFALLSIGVGALQLMLDRGEQLDWFAAPEIWVELGITVSAFWAFGVHMATAERPFLPPHLLRNRNLLTGLVFIFVIGVVVLAAMALLPPMLQRLMGYPTITTGMVMAPRGVGVMVSMLIVGHAMRVIDPRLLIFTGLCVTGWSLHMMTGFTIVMDSSPIILSGVIQGLGIGMVFVPLSTIAFATLAPADRADAAGLFSLVRNLGNSLGVSIVTAALAHFTQVNHAELAAHVSPFNPNIQGPLTMAGQATPELLAAADLMVNRQAAMIAYINDFKLMMVITLAAIPLLLLLRKPRGGAPADGHAAMME